MAETKAVALNSDRVVGAYALTYQRNDPEYTRIDAYFTP